MNAFFLSVIILAAPSPNMPTSKEIRKIEMRVAESKTEIEALKVSVRIAEKKKESLADDLKVRESRFTKQFSNILSPLLNWPEISLQTRIKSWVEREHGKFVLDMTRENLLREPLELIAERELNLRHASEASEELEIKLKSLESKQNLLNLQIEELKLLQKRANSSKKKST